MNRYMVYNPKTDFWIDCKSYRGAYDLAHAFSLDSRKAIEIKRYPVPYKAKHLIVVMP